MKHEHGDCKEIFAMLSEYLDAELDPATCGEIEEHLKDCAPCIEFLNSLKRTVRLCSCCVPEEKPAPLTPEQKSRLLSAYRRSLAARKA
jgi:predicted anti-sigma-YlaC factor YlaD